METVAEEKGWKSKVEEEEEGVPSVGASEAGRRRERARHEGTRARECVAAATARRRASPSGVGLSCCFRGGGLETTVVL